MLTQKSSAAQSSVRRMDWQKSSRNTYLSADERQAALVLSRSLKIGKQLVEAGEKSAKAVKDAITAEINKEPLCEN